MKYRAPVIGGNFATWSVLFNTCDCALVEIRQKEDPWNSIASGFITGGLIAVRSGPKMSLISAVIGGVFLSLIEGAQVLMGRYMAEQYRPPQNMHYAQPV